jgi:hypothetical protein
MTATVEDPIRDSLLTRNAERRPRAWRPDTDLITALRRPIFYRQALASG